MLTDFTFKDTGITVKIRKVSPLMATDVSASIPEPLPPEQEVDYGEPRGKRMEPNYSDPEYQVLLAKHHEKVSMTYQRLLVLRGVVVEGDEWRKEVKSYRDFILETTGAPLTEPDDLVVYVMRVCIGTQEDMMDLLNAITRRSQPTQEAIEQAKRTFRG